MYLTENEFKVLSGIIIGLNDKEMQKKFHLSLSDIKLNKNNLCKKYGAKESYRELKTIADLKKVEVAEPNAIPFFEYEGSVLVKKIKITKIDVIKLVVFFNRVPNRKEYELILDEDFGNMYRFLEIKDPVTNKKRTISSTIDGYDMSERDKK